VAHDRKLYQILDNTRAKKVMVEEYINGSMAIYHKDTSLKFKEIANRPKKAEEKPRYTFKLRKFYTPPKDHPWRLPIYSHYQHYSQKEKVAPKEKGLLLTLT
jgi:hypothetical protein